MNKPTIPSKLPNPTPHPGARPRRVAAIDWMRGFVMILMVIDHVSMAYDVNHLSVDSAALYSPATPLTDLAFFTRWISHICAPTFVFLAGTALALSVERKVEKGIPAIDIDKDLFYRGAFIALLDPTIISLFSGRWTFQVLYAIGVSFMCMVLLRRMSTAWLLTIAFAWLACGEWITSLVWPPEEASHPIIAALLVSTYSSANLSIKYPLLPWLSMMILGWVFGRYMLLYREEKVSTSPLMVMLISGALCLAIFAITRYLNAYGNMWLWLYQSENIWIQWIHVSKYPPSITYVTLELGLMFWLMAMFNVIEKRFGVRQNGVLLVFGQTAMFFYLVHRLLLEGSATYLGLRGFANLQAVYLISALVLAGLYPLCLWYRGYKKQHPNALWARYI